MAHCHWRQDKKLGGILLLMLLANCPTAISIKYTQDNFKSAILLKVWHNGPLPLEARKKIGGIFSYAAGKLSHCHQV